MAKLSAMNSIIRIEGLSYRYGVGEAILKNIDLEIAENEFIAIIGRNGSGKTTLLKNISGLLRPCGGKIFLRGNDTAAMSVAEIAGEIGFVMQDPDRQLFESTVHDEVAFALKRTLDAEEVRRKTEDALSLVALSDMRGVFPPALDRANRVKTVFAAVLAMGSGIIMLDEPVAGQDKRGCRLIMDILSKLHGQGYTVIMVTHNINIAAEYAKRIIVMKDGGVFLDGKPEDIFTQAEKLAEAGIVPPQITRLSHELRPHIPLERDALTPAQLAEMLAKAGNR